MSTSRRLPTVVGWACWLAALLVLTAAAGCEEPPTGGYQGYVEGEFVYVAAPLGGRLQRLAVTKGDEVGTGEALFELEAEQERAVAGEAKDRLKAARAQLRDLKKGARSSELAAAGAKLQQAQAERGLAEVEFNRRRRLRAAGAIAAQELDEARTQFERASESVRQLEAELATAGLGGREDAVAAARAKVQAQRQKLRQAQWSLDQKRQSAPAAGLVYDTLFEQGEWVAAGRPVVSLLPPQNRRVRFFVSENDLSAVTAGQAVRVVVGQNNASVAAAVSYISPQVEYTPPVIYSSRTRAKLVVMVEATAQGPAAAAALQPGMPVEVYLEAGHGR